MFPRGHLDRNLCCKYCPRWCSGTIYTASVPIQPWSPWEHALFTQHQSLSSHSPLGNMHYLHSISPYRVMVPLGTRTIYTASVPIQPWSPWEHVLFTRHQSLSSHGPLGNTHYLHSISPYPAMVPLGTCTIYTASVPIESWSPWEHALLAE